MKKIGSFFFTFIPFLLALVFQYLAMFFVMGVTLKKAGRTALSMALHASGVIDHSDAEIILDMQKDRKSTRLNSSHNVISRMPSSA